MTGHTGRSAGEREGVRQRLEDPVMGHSAEGDQGRALGGDVTEGG